MASATSDDIPRANQIWLWVLSSFAVYSFVQAPIPGVNEAHYLTKARHYWQPEWCASDLFLQSSNAHLVFYQVFGWQAHWLSLFQMAIVGRLCGLALLAWGWTSVCRALLGEGAATVWAAWFFLCLASAGSFSGEWVVGGFESKVFAYGFAFGALGEAMRSRWLWSGGLLGLAVCIHPVVGMWFTICGGVAFSLSGVMLEQIRSPHTRRTLALSAAAWIVCAAPGLIPALRLVLHPGLSATELLDADWIQVFFRLAHHLDPMRFSVQRYVSFAALAVIFAVLLRLNRQSAATAYSMATVSGWRLTVMQSRASAWRSFSCLIWMAVLVAFVGVVLGLRQGAETDMPAFALRTKLLKFYPFRLFDVLLPMAVCVVSAGYLEQFLRHAPTRLPRAVPCVALVVALLMPVPSRNPSRMPPDRLAAWIEACEWIGQETPVASLVLAPRSGFSFKWYAERAEYLSPKDCPQDAPGIREWFQRYRYVKRWEAIGVRDGAYTAHQLAALRDEFDISVLVVGDPRIAVNWPAAFENDHYRIFVLHVPVTDEMR